MHHNVVDVCSMGEYKFLPPWILCKFRSVCLGPPVSSLIVATNTKNETNKLTQMMAQGAMTMIDGKAMLCEGLVKIGMSKHTIEGISNFLCTDSLSNLWDPFLIKSLCTITEHLTFNMVLVAYILMACIFFQLISLVIVGGFFFYGYEQIKNAFLILCCFHFIANVILLQIAYYLTLSQKATIGMISGLYNTSLTSYHGLAAPMLSTSVALFVLIVAGMFMNNVMTMEEYTDRFEELKLVRTKIMGLGGYVYGTYL
eukprot:GHVH01013062.1.p1 GENE.GHVH01013062.1~~GHVH01013062.1.p1  ORF type:complete len:271 (+),score=18.06 GHVH01013062.1:47-814(+)